MTQKELKFGSTQHQDILKQLVARKRFSWEKMRTKHSRWKQDEEKHRAYIKETDADKIRKTNRKSGKMEYTTIEIPYSYGLVMAAHTYWASTFLARTPILQYQARHGQTAEGEQAVEAYMDYQTTIGGHLIPYYIWLLDAPKYGVGVVGTYWDKEIIRTAKLVEVPQTFAGVPLAGKTKREKQTFTIPGYEGNRIFNIRPQDFIFDPRVTLANFQSGEFAGRALEISWNDIVRGQQQGRYYNIEAIRRSARSGVTSTGDGDRDLGSAQLEIPNISENPTEQSSINTLGYNPGFELVVDLIPKDWGLGTSTAPEKWVFTVVDDKYIIGSTPLGEFHDKYPYGVLEYEIDGHQLHKRSMIEILEPLNDTLTWLINSHFFNVRKSLNNMFVYDPTKVNAKDFENPDAGLGIRLKPAAYGTPIENCFKQFPVHDITRSHITDTGPIISFMQRVSGVNDAIMGMMSQQGRRTAAEFRGSTSFGINRLKTQAEYMSAMGFGPLSQMMLQSSQQHYDQEKKFKIAGDLLPNMNRDIMVTPDAIAGFFDFVPVDGTMPVDKFAQATLWKDIMMGMAKMPGLAQQYDFGAIFAYTAQLGGAKNIQRFKIKMTEDGEAIRRAQTGELVPADGGIANAARASTGAGSILNGGGGA